MAAATCLSNSFRCLDCAIASRSWSSNHRAKGVGTWEGKVTTWMMPDSPPGQSTCETKIISMMGGRFTRNETTGDMPGMGPFEGFGLYGFDNVIRKYTSVWIDNMGTGMMAGTGELSADGKTMTWTLKANDPATGKEATWREIERYTGDHSMVLEMYGPDPISHKEYKVMQIDYTRKAGTAPAPKSTPIEK